MNEFLLCFVPLFVAVDAVGLLPMFLGLIQGVAVARVRKVIAQSVVTAAVVSLLFLFLGRLLMRFLGITIADFMLAGGVLLFIISISDLLHTDKPQRRVDVESLGAVPLGVPLIVGPAVLTTSLIQQDLYGSGLTSLSLVLNILIAGLVFSFARPLHQLLGKAGAKTISKLASILLAAIAVMQVRRGIQLMLTDKLCW